MWVLRAKDTLKYRRPGAPWRGNRWTHNLQKARVYHRLCDLSNSATCIGLCRDEYEVVPVYLEPTKETP